MQLTDALSHQNQAAVIDAVFTGAQAEKLISILGLDAGVKNRFAFITSGSDISHAINKF